MKDTEFDAPMAMRSPVRGFRPSRAGRLFLVNVPKPMMATVSPRSSASPMTSTSCPRWVEQDAPRALSGDGAERGQAHAVRQALEQAAAEAALEPGDVAGERRLGDVGAFRRRADPSRLGDGEEPDETLKLARQSSTLLRRGKVLSPSGCESRPASVAPAGSNRSG